jgi:hypothetical protein
MKSIILATTIALLTASLPLVAGAATFLHKTAAHTAEAGELILADTSGGTWILTLPASPSQGHMIQVFDYAGSFATNNLTVDRNGSKIDATDGDLLLDVSGTKVKLIYINQAQGWRVY